MSTQPSEDQVVQAVYEHAASLVKDGKSKPEVVADLVSQGLNEDSATAVADNIFIFRAKATKKAGEKNMLFGALWCIGGIVVTALTYQAAASSPAGGHYIVTWGAIIFGAIQFFRGLAQTAKYSADLEGEDLKKDEAIVQCPYCKESVELEENERIDLKFTCPLCHRDVNSGDFPARMRPESPG